MKNKIAGLLAFILRRRFLWCMNHLVEAWRKDIPKYQVRRARAPGSRVSGNAGENARAFVNLWDRIKKNPAWPKPDGV